MAEATEREELDTGTDELLASRQDGVVTLTFNRPERRNALSDTLTPALRAMLETLAADDAVRALVLTGAGTSFCAGGDVKGMGASGSAPARPRSRDASVRELTKRQETLTLRLARFPRPTIAALPGAAAGAGLSIALACDIRIMAEGAFVTTGFRNVGLPGDYGGTWLLQRLVGTAQAKLLYFTGERVDAERCLALGIAQQVVKAEELRATAEALARHCADGPPVALAWMKRNIDRASTGDLAAALADEALGTVDCAATEDHREAVAAFLERRSPRFSGR
jgi:enoyl-CoA hydratase/carnithine racemase